MRQLLARHDFLAGIGDEALETVVGCAQNAAFESGELLCTEGASADTFYLLRRGRVSLEVHAPGRGPVVIETVEPGSVVGWSWLVPPYRWTLDARAIGPVGAVAIDGACLREKAERDPSLGYALLTRISAHLLARLQATRIRALDLYGTGHGDS
jgi:CRP-like cAMP-binding protein